MARGLLAIASSNRNQLPLLILGLTLFAGLGIGYQIALARGGKPSKPAATPSDRAVSDKAWITGQQMVDRFPKAKHEEFMRRAIANSRLAGVVKRTGGAFGAVIVDREGQVIADGVNHVVAEFDPTWHAEMHAIRQACSRLKTLKLDGCILYTSSEPCPMCLATAYWAGLDGLFYGAKVDDSKKYGGFDDAFIYTEFARSNEDRAIPELPLLRDEAVTVWKEYASLPDNIPY
jgi:tRNA(Arg) A34 adenosine deaminase TadA